MSLMDEIEQRLHAAIKARDSRLADCLRMLKSRIIEKRTSSGFEGKLTDEIVRDVAVTYVKQLKKSIAEFEKAGDAGRTLIEKTNWEIEQLNEYLPTLLDEAATRKIVEDAIASSGVPSTGGGGAANHGGAGGSCTGGGAGT